MSKSYQCVIERSNGPVKGFTLIEILITVVVFSIGLIGLASLQTVALKNNNDSYMRSQAVLLAQDIADRMRANRVAVNDGDYNMNDVTPDVVAFNCTNGSMPGGNTTCTDQEMAQADLYSWAVGRTADNEPSVAEALPNGQGIVCIDSTPETNATPSNPRCDGIGNVYAIKIWWDEDHSGAIDGDDPVFTTSFRP